MTNEFRIIPCQKKDCRPINRLINDYHFLFCAMFHCILVCVQLIFRIIQKADGLFSVLLITDFSRTFFYMYLSWLMTVKLSLKLFCKLLILLAICFNVIFMKTCFCYQLVAMNSRDIFTWHLYRNSMTQRRNRPVSMQQR